MKPGKKWTDVARLMQYHVERNGFSVVREFVGHGVGRSMHEDPKVPNFVTQEHLRGDFRLRPGMTIAVEPMVTMGRRDVELLSDGWTVVSADRLPAAHFEHTVAISDTGADVLSDGRVPMAARRGVMRPSWRRADQANGFGGVRHGSLEHIGSGVLYPTIRRLVAGRGVPLVLYPTFAGWSAIARPGVRASHESAKQRQADL